MIDIISRVRTIKSYQSSFPLCKAYIFVLFVLKISLQDNYGHKKKSTKITFDELTNSRNESTKHVPT